MPTLGDGAHAIKSSRDLPANGARCIRIVAEVDSRQQGGFEIVRRRKRPERALETINTTYPVPRIAGGFFPRNEPAATDTTFGVSGVFTHNLSTGAKCGLKSSLFERPWIAPTIRLAK